MQVNELLEDTTQFLNEEDGCNYYFRKYYKKSNRLLCWKEKGVNTPNNLECLGVPVMSMSIDNLKEIDIWDKLPQETQQKLVEQKEASKHIVHKKMEHARRGRKPKYPGMPREYKCTTCDHVQAIAPCIVRDRIEKKRILLDDFIKSFQCQKCHPTKGRQKKTTPLIPQIVKAKKTKIVKTKKGKKSKKKN